jgi:hypothetical protein
MFKLLIKLSRASSRVKWLKVDKTDVSRTISVLVLSFPFNHLTRLEALEKFINLSRRESLKSYVFKLYCQTIQADTTSVIYSHPLILRTE